MDGEKVDPDSIDNDQDHHKDQDDDDNEYDISDDSLSDDSFHPELSSLSPGPILPIVTTPPHPNRTRGAGSDGGLGEGLRLDPESPDDAVVRAAAGENEEAEEDSPFSSSVMRLPLMDNDDRGGVGNGVGIGNGNGGTNFDLKIGYGNEGSSDLCLSCGDDDAHHTDGVIEKQQQQQQAQGVVLSPGTAVAPVATLGAGAGGEFGVGVGDEAEAGSRMGACQGPRTSYGRARGQTE